MLAAGRALLTATGNTERTTSVEVLAPAIITNPNFPDQTTLDWGNPTVTATVGGVLQPASTRALERIGRIGSVGLHELHLDATPLTPEGRVRIGSSTYSVLDARVWATHTEAVVEAV